jgi:Lrp/AsnC family transcriptional regulator for asnA, asnC and gidA
MKKNNEKNSNRPEESNKSIGKKLDKVDRSLIHLLQKDGRMPNNAIAQELGISEFTVRRRMKRLLDNNIIRIVAVANPIDLGFEIAGNLKIKIDLKKADQVLKKLKKIDSVIWVALTTGGTDIDVDFVASSLKEFHELLFKKISKIDGVVSTETSLMVDLVKDEYAWGTAWDPK